MRRGSLTESQRLWAWHLDSRLQIDPKLFATGRVACADNKAITEPLRIPDDERLREHDHFRPHCGRFSDQANCLVDTSLSVERHGCRLYYGHLNRGFFRGQGECQSLISNCRRDRPLARR